MHDWSSFTFSNAAGFIKRPDDKRFHDLLRFPDVKRIVVGSFCTLKRHGNIGDTYHFDEDALTSINSRGLPSPPIEESRRYLHGMYEDAEKAGKELHVSVAAFSPAECASLLAHATHVSHRREWNASCGNVWGSGGQKPIPSRHPELFRKSMQAIEQSFNGNPISVKLSPAETDEHLDALDEIAEIIMEFSFVCAVISGNTLPNQQRTKADGTQALRFREDAKAEEKHVGGVGGRDVKPYSIKTAKFLREKLPSSIEVVGCGGIFDGQDVLDYQAVGVSGVQVGTAFGEYGARAFSQIMDDLGKAAA